MSDWCLPRPDQKYMDRAWEKSPLMKTIVDRLATTEGLQAQVEEWVDEYTTEENARYRAYQAQGRIRREAQIYALWLEHMDEMEQYRAQVEETNKAAWTVYRKVLETQRAGRKTVRIDALMEETNE